MDMCKHFTLGRGLCFAGIIALHVAIPKTANAQPQFTQLHSFNGTDGFGPMAGMTEGADRALYGTTSGQLNSPIVATVFRYDPSTQEFTTLHFFTDGARIFSGLTQGHDGLLYGTTYSGGTADLGTLYGLGPDGQNFALLYSFDGTDGAKPDDFKLLQGIDDTLFGATSEGGSGDGGTLFRFDANSREMATIYSFNSTGGVDPGLVMGIDGYWYGTTYSGGAYGAGSIFRLDPITFELATLHDFTSTGGANPVPGALTQGASGDLYGTTQLGGGYGTVFKLNPSTLAFQTLHAFSGVNDGRMPLGGVTEGGDGYLYGTTVLGGFEYGTIYRVHPTTLTYNIVLTFNGANGRSPSGNLVRASDGFLYGVTRLGGTFNGGTLFRLGFADTSPPTITSITARPDVLWPANGRMVNVALTALATDAVDPAPACTITGVSSNQSGRGQWVITGDLTLRLQAKRSGGTTRTYTITVECADVSGNTSTGTVFVSVGK